MKSKFFWTFIIVLGLANNLYSADIKSEIDKKYFKMPTAEVLLQKLIKFNNFAEVTKLHEKLGSKEIRALGICQAFNDAYDFYKKCFGITEDTALILSCKKEIVKILLPESHVDDLKELEELGFFEFSNFD